MWPFKEKQEKPKFDDDWRKSMLLRWTDLEARVTAIELNDKEYKKTVRNRFKKTEEETQDIKGSVLIAE